MPYLHVNDCDLHYDELGDGRPVVFVHGVWMSGRFFAHQRAAFPERFRTLFLDLRGHGRSERTQAGNTVAQHARDLRAFCEALGLQDAVVVGWSMGSLVAFDYIRQFGTDGLGGLVVVDQSPTDFKWLDWPHGLFDLASLHDIHTGVQEDQQTTAAQFAALLCKEPPAPSDLEWMTREIASVPPAIACAILVDQSLVDYRDLLPQVTVPTLLCIGGAETIVPVAAGEYMRDRMPDAKLVVFEQSSHCPFLEEPQRFNQVVGDFVAALR